MEDDLYHIGSWPDFPELAGEYFIDLKAILNRVISPIDICIVNTKIDSFSKNIIYFDIKSKNGLETQSIHYDHLETYEDLLKCTVDILNKDIERKDIFDEVIFKKALTDNEEYNDCNYHFHLISKKKTVTFDDVKPAKSIEYYEYAYALPFHSKEELSLIFNDIANLNQNNTLTFEFVDVPNTSDGSIENIKVLFKTNEKEKTYDFNINDTDTIGLTINNFLDLTDEKYSAYFINNNETIVYSYCTKAEFDELCKFQFILPKYIPQSSQHKDIIYTYENFPPTVEEIEEANKNLEKTFGKDGFDRIKKIFSKWKK